MKTITIDFEIYQKELEDLRQVAFSDGFEEGQLESIGIAMATLENSEIDDEINYLESIIAKGSPNRVDIKTVSFLKKLKLNLKI